MAVTVLHADLDAFFASVEQRDEPALRGRPVIVGGGVVLACSYEAKARGVASAMGGAQARRLCPDAVVVPPRFRAYVEASRRVFELFDETAPVVEALSIDEAFLDISGLEPIAGPPERIAARLRAAVRERVGLPITVGGARTKSVAKVASAAAKPDGLLIVHPDREREFLDPLPVDRLWGCGPVASQKLRARGFHTVGQVARASRDDLAEIVGRATGRHLHAMSHGRDPRRVRRTRGRGSFGSQSAFGRRPRSPEAHDATLVALVDRVTRRMRKAGRTGRTVTLRLRFGDYTRATRSHTLTEPTASSEAVLPTIRSLLRAAQPVIAQRGGLTLLGVTVSGLDGERDAEQLALPLEHPGRSAVDGLLDDVRDRFGTAAVTRASLVGRGPALQTWLMPGEDPDDLA